VLPADVGAVLESINVDPEAVRAILTMLESGAESTREASRIDKVPAGRFGGSDAGADLAANVAIAHDKFKTALDDMVIGLTGYRDNIDTYTRNQLGTDEAVGSALNSANSNATILAGIQSSADCVNTPTVAADSACEMPADGADS
jgi:hypothetical protein